MPSVDIGLDVASLGPGVVLVVLALSVGLGLNWLMNKTREAVDRQRNKFTDSMAAEVRDLRNLVFQLRKEQEADRAVMHTLRLDLSDEKGARTRLEQENQRLRDRVEVLEAENKRLKERAGWG